MGISSPGIGSNLDINGIVAKLMQAESQPLTALAKKEASYQAKLSGLGNLSGALGALQTALASLNTQSTFQAVNATSADTSIFTASAAPTAAPGTYSVNVTQLAQAQSLTSAGQTSTTATIGTGTATTLTFQFGTITGGKLVNGTYVNDPTATPPNPTFTQDPNQASGTVTINNTNNSLQGIRDAINKANLGVTATIVSDGSATPYHLVIKSNNTGAKSSMKISVTGTEPALTNLLAYDPAATQNMTQGTAAQNAALTVNGIAVTSQTNTITGAIQDVTLNAVKIGTANLTIARDTAAVQSSVNAFVKAYNDLHSTIKKLSGYDAATKQAGILIGDASVRNIDMGLRKMLSSPTTGSTSNLKTLRDVGISVDKDGVMSVDTGKLSTAMTNNMADVTALFSSIGTTTDSLVSYVSSTSATAPGTNAVFVTQLASQGKLVGSQAVGTTITTANKDLSVTVNGVTATVSLIPGTYTASDLAAQVRSAINGASAFSSAGIAVSVTLDAANVMTVSSNTYGSTSKVAISGSGASNLLGAAPVATAGVDVAGTIGGVAAGGSGQFLTGASGSPAAGLKLQVTGGAAGASPGANRGTVTFSQGYAFQLNKLVEGFLGDQGVIAARKNGINNTIKDLEKQNATLNMRLADIEKRYRAQFTALDVTISQMTSTSTYLTQQLAQISNLSKQ